MREIETERQEEIEGGLMGMCASAWVVGATAYAIFGMAVLEPAVINIQIWC